MFLNILQQSFGDSQGVSLNRQGVSIVPDVIAEENNTNEIFIPSKFKADIVSLEEYLGHKLESGLCINLNLSEVLNICPRARKRVDAYTSLCKFLSKMGVELNIKSQKSKKYES